MDVEQVNQISQVLALVVGEARNRPDRRLDIHDHTGAIVATVHAHDLPKRPQDMPRALRPKHKLSKRQRQAARRAKERNA